MLFRSFDIHSPIDPSRGDALHDPAYHGPEVLKFMGVKPGWKVADVFPGRFTTAIAQAVGPKGKVYGFMPEEIFKVHPGLVDLQAKRAADPDDQITALLAVSGSTLLAATNDCQSQSDPDGTLTAYNVATGAVQWAVHRDAPIYAMIVNTGIAVVTGGDAGSDVATGYRVSNGKQAWNRTGVRTDVAVSAGGRILLTNVDGSGAVAVSVATGAKVWSTSQRWSAVAASTDGHRMFVTTPAGDLLDVYGTTGGVAWTAKGMAGAIAVDGSRVYIGHDVNLTALSWAGKLLWDDTIGFQVGRPVVAGGVLYAPQQGASLLVMKASNGAFADGNPPYAGAIGHAVVVNGRLYVTDGRVLDVFSP